MARRRRERNQTGWIKTTENGEYQAHWYEYVFEPASGGQVRRHRSRIVGAVNQITKAKAEKELAKIVAPLNETRGPQADGRLPFKDFYENIFLPRKQSRWGKPMLEGFKGDVARYVLPDFGHVPLEELEDSMLQRWLDNMAAEDFSESKVKNTKQWVSMILKEARRMGHIRTNPMEFVGIPQTRPTIKPVLQPWELNELVFGDAIKNQRDRLIVLIGTTCALVASELFGLVWECVFPDKLLIRSTAWKGELREYRVKRKKRMRVVPITPQIYSALLEWKSRSRETGYIGDLVFPGQGRRKQREYSGPATMWSSTFLHFQIQPIARRLGILTPVTFQVLRRSFITHNRQNLKDAQDVAGHADPNTTAKVYAQEVTESARKMVADYTERIKKAKRPKVAEVPVPAIEAKPVTRRVQ